MKNLMLLVGIAMLSACTAIKPVDTAPLTTYTLNRVSKVKLSNRPNHLTLLVTKTTASPGYDSNHLVYVEKPYQLQRYTKNAWVAPPATMITPLIVESIRNSDRFHAVVSAPFAGITELRLDTQLLKLQQEFLSKHSKVRLILRAELIDNISNRVIASKRIDVVQPAASNDPYGGVQAANRALEKSLVYLMHFVSKQALNRERSN